MLGLRIQPPGGWGGVLNNVRHKGAMLGLRIQPPGGWGGVLNNVRHKGAMLGLRIGGGGLYSTMSGIRVQSWD